MFEYLGVQLHVPLEMFWALSFHLEKNLADTTEIGGQKSSSKYVKFNNVGIS